MLLSLLSVLLPVLVSAAPPTRPNELLAVAPRVTEPDAFTLWFAGTQEVVKWDTTEVPKEAQNYTIQVLLGYLENDSENLNTASPLAKNIPIMQGSATVLVPSNTPTRDDYIVVVEGDSGNRSPKFTILQD